MKHAIFTLKIVMILCGFKLRKKVFLRISIRALSSTCWECVLRTPENKKKEKKQ